VTSAGRWYDVGSSTRGPMIDLQSDTLVTWSGLSNRATDSYVNDATVSGAVKDRDDNLLGNFSLSYVASSSGKYQGYITAAMVAGLTPSDEVTIELAATSGAFTSFRRWEEPVGYRGTK
jgi:hypothetical protein